LGEIVKYHMERLRLLNLDGAPAGVAMGEVTRIWAETIAGRNVAWDRELDTPRLHQAFMELAAHCDRWPTPNMLMQRLPGRPERKKLEAPKPSPEERERNRQRVRSMLRDAMKGVRR
jgi:hypothetical protein